MASLNIDPDFNTPGHPIFQAADGVCFRFPWEPLVTNSSFFRDLTSIPLPPCDDPDTQEVIPLLSATSIALKLVFQVLSPNKWPRQKVKPFPYEHLEEVFIIADAYDLNAVLECLYKSSNDPFVVFTMAMALRDVAKIELAAHAVMRAAQIPPEIDFLLWIKSPVARAKLHRLREYHKTHITVKLFKHKAKILALSKYHLFNKSCRREPPCSPSTKWDNFCSLAFKEITRAISLIEAGHGPQVIIDAVVAGIGCPTCAGRMSQLMSDAVGSARPGTDGILKLHHFEPWF